MLAWQQIVQRQHAAHLRRRWHVQRRRIQMRCALHRRRYLRRLHTRIYAMQRRRTTDVQRGRTMDKHEDVRQRLSKWRLHGRVQTRNGSVQRQRPANVRRQWCLAGRQTVRECVYRRRALRRVQPGRQEVQRSATANVRRERQVREHWKRVSVHLLRWYMQRELRSWRCQVHGERASVV